MTQHENRWEIENAVHIASYIEFMMCYNCWREIRFVAVSMMTTKRQNTITLGPRCKKVLTTHQTTTSIIKLWRLPHCNSIYPHECLWLFLFTSHLNINIAVNIIRCSFCSSTLLLASKQNISRKNEGKEFK